MSTKATIKLLPCCHIYNDYIGSNGKETFCVEVHYGSVQDGRDSQDLIEVNHDSDFAKLMRYLLEGKTEEELQEAIEG